MSATSSAAAVGQYLEPKAKAKRKAAPVKARPANPTVTVVIPTLNEAANLPYVFARMPDCVTEVVLVDGRSTDDTIGVAQEVWPSVRVVLERRKGKGAALAAGFARATGDIIVMLDADGSADAAEIPLFVRALTDGADFAKGTRFGAGGASHDITWVRRLGNWGLSTAVNVLYRTGYTDLCYGYNAFWADCLPHMGVGRHGFEVETHINIRIGEANLRVVEVPSIEYGRIHGESNLHPIRDGIRVAKTILRELRLKWSRDQSAAELAAVAFYGTSQLSATWPHSGWALHERRTWSQHWTGAAPQIEIA